MEPTMAEDSSSLWTESSPEKYVYNIPDAYEQDPDIIRAELMFFNTPQSQAFSGEAYYALKNVQDQCQLDYEKFCSSSYMPFGDIQMLMEKLFSSSFPFLMSRRLHETKESAFPEKYKGRKLLEYLRSFYNPNAAKNDPPLPFSHNSVLNKGSKLSSTASEPAVRNSEHKAVTGVRSHVMRGVDNIKLAHAMKGDRRKLVKAEAMMSNEVRPAGKERAEDESSSSTEIFIVDAPMVFSDMRERPAPELSFGWPMASRLPMMGMDILAHPEPAPMFVAASSPVMMVDPMPTDMLVAKDSATTKDRREPPAKHAPPPPPNSGRPGPPPRPPHDNKNDDAVDAGTSSPGHPGSAPPSGEHPPGPPHHPPRPPSDDSDSDDDEEDDRHHRRPHHHDRPDRLEDSFFPGALGFGASGDMCLYENVQNLSPPCTQAIGDVYALRQQYWTSYTAAQDEAHHHHPGFGLFFVGLVLVVLVKKIMYAPRRRHMQKFLSALNDNPELKAQLESQLNMKVPVPYKATCCGGERSSCCRRFFFAVGYLFFAFFASVFIAVTSLEMTAGIVDGMGSHRQGEEPPVSPFTVLLILGMIVVGQLVLLRLLTRTVCNVWRRNCGSTIADDNDEDNHGERTTTTAASSTGSNGGLHVEFQRLATLPVSFYREYVSPRVTSFFATRHAAAEGYAPLQANGSEEREMIAVGRGVNSSSSHGGAPTQYAVYTGVPINPQNVMHVTARPISAVNLV